MVACGSRVSGLLATTTIWWQTSRNTPRISRQPQGGGCGLEIEKEERCLWLSLLEIACDSPLYLAYI